MFLVRSSFSDTFKESVTRFSASGFFTNYFPHGPVYPIGAISNFYEKAQINLKIKNLKKVENRVRLNFIHDSKTAVHIKR
jgi:hypothetical protein